MKTLFNTKTLRRRLEDLSIDTGNLLQVLYNPDNHVENYIYEPTGDLYIVSGDLSQIVYSTVSGVEIKVPNQSENDNTVILESLQSIVDGVDHFGVTASKEPDEKPVFTKFSSLENGYRQKFINNCATLCVKEWVATEKIHGANFSFIVKQTDEKYMVSPAKRTSVIGPNELGEYSFFGCTELVVDHHSRVIDLHQKLIEDGVIEPTETIQLYGELFGRGVQREVDYGPDRYFMAYDIMVLRDNDHSNPMRWIDHDSVVSYCEAVGIATVPEIARGTLEELLLISPEFKTLVGDSDKEDNASEGFVIKQLKNERPLIKGGGRACVKVKSEAFKEKKGKGAKTPTETVPLTDEQSAVYTEFSKYLNANRLSNVVSKIGAITQKDFGKLSGLLLKDAKDEFERDELDGELIDIEVWKALKKSLFSLSMTVVREDFLNLIDESQ